MADSFPHVDAVFAFTFSILVIIAFLRVVVFVTGGIVVRSSTWSPAVLRPMSSSATVLARVDVCGARVGRAGCAISFRDLVFAFALLLTFLERVDLHPVIIICVQLTRSDSLQSFGKCNTIATKLLEERHCWDMFSTANSS